MNPTPGRQALYHFAAAALIGLALTATSSILPDLIARQQMLAPQTAGYAVLSLLIGGGMAAYGYVTAHQSQLVDKVSALLDAASGAGFQPAIPEQHPAVSGVAAPPTTTEQVNATATGAAQPASPAQQQQ